MTIKKTYQVETNSGHIQVRRRTVRIVDGVAKGGNLHRHCIAPGDDYSAEPEKVQRCCAAHHTPERIQKYRDDQALREAGSEPVRPDNYEQIETVVREDDLVVVTRTTHSTEDGEHFVEHHPHVGVEPGDTLTNAPESVLAMIEAAHTPEVKAAYQAKRAAVAKQAGDL